MNIKNKIISLFLITLGITLIIQPLTETKADNNSIITSSSDIINENKEEVIKPKRLNINVAIDSPEDIKVKEGEEIKKGQIIATRDKIKKQLYSQLNKLNNNKKRLINLKPLPPNSPKDIPSLSVLPPISYLEFEAEIERKKINIDFINDEIEVKNQEINYLSELKELDEKVINHEKAKLNKLKQKLTIASKEYQLAKGKFETAKSQRKYQEYQAQINRVKRIENINQQRLDYDRQLAIYKQQLTDYEIKINNINEQINEIEKAIANTTNSSSPYNGTVRRIKFLGQSSDGTINAEISLLVKK